MDNKEETGPRDGPNTHTNNAKNPGKGVQKRVGSEQLHIEVTQRTFDAIMSILNDINRRKNPYNNDNNSTSEGDDDASFHSISSLEMKDEERGQITMGESFNTSKSVRDDTETTFEDSFRKDDDEDMMEDIPIESSDFGGSLPSPEDIRMMIYSRHASSSGSNFKGRGCYFWGLLTVTTALLISGVVLLVNGNSSLNSSWKNNRPRAELHEINHFLLKNKISSKENLTTSGTPQFKASRWLTNHDPAALPIPIDIDIHKSQEAYLYMTRYVMAVNYFAMSGEKEWTNSLNFLSEKHVCEWWDSVKSGDREYPTGLRCNEFAEPEDLVIDFNSMHGEIPTENGMLTTLKTFDFKGNSLAGSIPTELCQLTDLTTLSLGYNLFEGGIPECHGRLTNLEILFLSNNFLEGGLPFHMKHLTKLRGLFIDNNMLTGNIHHVIKFLTNLEFLYGEGNGFTGPINNVFATKHQNLQHIDLSDNQLEMTHVFPVSVLELPQLEILDLSYNNMAGKLPTKVIEGSQLKFLALHNNNLNGTLPHQTLTSFINLQHIDVSDNQLTGTMPTEWGSQLTALFLANNPLKPGPIPDAVNAMSELEELCLKNTNRQGGLPELAGLNSLIMLDLDQNQLTGTVPESWSQLLQLKYLLLNRNPGISGEIASSGTSYGNIEVAYLDGTALTGDIEFMCSSPSSLQASIVANCGDDHITSCSCCQCCNTTEACSDPMVASLDAKWESRFRRTNYYFDERVDM